MTGIFFTAENFRQYVYCPRVIYFRQVALIEQRQSYKMKIGSSYHDEKVRKQRQSKIDDLIINYNIYLEDQELGLGALFDAIATDSSGHYYPIEFKTGKTYGIVPEHHFAQMVAQVIILEKCYNTIVEKAQLRYGSEKRIDFTITEQDKMQVLALHTEMIQMVLNDLLPPPTPHKAKCHDCEFWIACRRA